MSNQKRWEELNSSVQQAMILAHDPLSVISKDTDDNIRWARNVAIALGRQDVIDDLNTVAALARELIIKMSIPYDLPGPYGRIKKIHMETPFVKGDMVFCQEKKQIKHIGEPTQNRIKQLADFAFYNYELLNLGDSIDRNAAAALAWLIIEYSRKKYARIWREDVEYETWLNIEPDMYDLYIAAGGWWVWDSTASCPRFVPERLWKTKVTERYPTSESVNTEIYRIIKEK